MRHTRGDVVSKQNVGMSIALFHRELRPNTITEGNNAL